ncbi:hypothetical protein ACOMHN_049099 [Nucella lapillus]
MSGDDAAIRRQPTLSSAFRSSVDHEAVEDACVKMLLELAPLNAGLVFSVLQAWFRARPWGSLPRPLIGQIMTLRNLILRRAPHLKLPAFY